MKRRFFPFMRILAACAAISFFAAPRAYAATPALSLASAGGDSVQITVQGDPDAGVTFRYNIGNSAGELTTTLGKTSASGAFSTTISSASYGVNSGSQVYVTVNGQQSVQQVWPYGNSTGSTAAASASGVPALVPNPLTIGLGQTATVASQGNSNGIYLLSNSSPTTATISANGTQITITGNQLGSATARVCYVGSASGCADLSITVTSGTTTTTTSGSLAFSQQNPALAVGQVMNVNISGGSGYYISGTTNASVTTQTISGSVLTITGLANGAATITVCSISSGCSSVSITVGTAANTSQQAGITFGTTNPTITTGQSVNVALSGGSGGYFISNNPSPNIVQATINGATLTLTGKGAGSAFVMVCATSGGCNTIFFTVVNAVAGTTALANISTSIIAPAAIATTPVPVQITQNVSNSEVLTAIQSMQSKLLQIVSEIQSMQATLLQLVSKIALNASPSGNAAVSAQPNKYRFLSPLSVGSSGADVTALQTRLTTEGFYSGPITGFFGTLTKNAVAKYQSARGLTPSENLDVSTRAALNAGM